MPRYFMSDTRLGWLEKMMMSRPSPSRAAPRQKTPQKKMLCNRPVPSTVHVPQRKEGGI